MTNQRYHPDLGSETSSVLNLCGCSSDVILSGNQWWCSKMLAVFSGYTGQQRERKTSGGGGYSEFQVTGIIEWPGQKSKIKKNSLGLLICNPPKIPRPQISLSSGFVFTLERGTPLWIDSTEVCAWLILTIQVQTVWWDFLSILCLDYPVFWSKLLGSTLLPTSLHNKCFMSQAMWTWHFAWSARQGEDKNRAPVTSPLFWLFPRSLHEHHLPIG